MFYDLAMCNIGHYQKTADYENGVHLTTIPTLWVTGHEDRNNDGDKEVIHLGWDAALIFPEAEAKVGNLSFSGVGLVHSETAITQSLADMAILGSRLLASERVYLKVLTLHVFTEPERMRHLQHLQRISVRGLLRFLISWQSGLILREL